MPHKVAHIRKTGANMMFYTEYVWRKLWKLVKYPILGSVLGAVLGAIGVTIYYEALVYSYNIADGINEAAHNMYLGLCFVPWLIIIFPWASTPVIIGAVVGLVIGGVFGFWRNYAIQNQHRTTDDNSKDQGE